MANYQDVPYEELPEEQQDAVKSLVSSTFDNITAMTPEMRESMTTICYQQLEPELREMDVEEFGCSSYYEFLCQIVLAAAAVDNEFSLAEEEAVDEIMKTLGLLGQPYEGDIAKMERINLDLVELSRKLKPTLRGMLMTFVSLIFLCDKELADEEKDAMIHILAP